MRLWSVLIRFFFFPQHPSRSQICQNFFFRTKRENAKVRKLFWSSCLSIQRRREKKAPLLFCNFSFLQTLRVSSAVISKYFTPPLLESRNWSKSSFLVSVQLFAHFLNYYKITCLIFFGNILSFQDNFFQLSARFVSLQFPSYKMTAAIMTPDWEWSFFLNFNLSQNISNFIEIEFLLKKNVRLVFNFSSNWEHFGK